MPVYAGQRLTAAVLNGLPGDLVAFTTGNVTNSALETAIGTFSAAIGANDAVVGGGYQFLVFGTTDTIATPTIRFRLYCGPVVSGNLIGDFGTQTTSAGATNKPWWLKVWMIVTATGSAGTFEAGGIADSSNVSGGPFASSRTAVAINTTIANDVILTAQWGTASASNTARTLAGAAQRT
jgi:hypothetical protein